MLQVGDTAPEFEAEDQHGQRVALADFRGRKVVVLFFYPKDYSPICTREVCSFRDAYEQFSDAGAEVLGVSGDSVGSHADFATAHGLPFRILSDSQGALRQSFAVGRTMGLLPGRVTFVIDMAGIIRQAFVAPFSADKHVEQTLDCVRGLRSD